MKIICKKCLLADIDRDAYTEKLMEYIAAVPYVRCLRLLCGTPCAETRTKLSRGRQILVNKYFFYCSLFLRRAVFYCREHFFLVQKIVLHFIFYKNLL